MAYEEATVLLSQHVVGDIGKPQPLVLALFKCGVKVRHARRVGMHRSMFLVGAETLE